MTVENKLISYKTFLRFSNGKLCQVIFWGYLGTFNVHKRLRLVFIAKELKKRRTII